MLTFPFSWANYCFSQYKNKKFFIKFKNTEDIFTEIYKSKYWGSNESVSGPGSSALSTENLREKLPSLLKTFSIRSIFDAPCGDLNWMKLLLSKINVQYIGGDIVKDLIQAHILKYKNDMTNFIHIDLVSDKFPTTDLMICRDCLFHLSYEDTKLVLTNFINSGTPYLLTTTYKNFSGFKNKNIMTGNYRRIDLFSPPYLFDSKPLARIDDWIHPEPEREMCLWGREQIIASLNRAQA